MLKENLGFWMKRNNKYNGQTTRKIYDNVDEANTTGQAHDRCSLDIFYVINKIIGYIEFWVRGTLCDKISFCLFPLASP